MESLHRWTTTGDTSHGEGCAWNRFTWAETRTLGLDLEITIATGPRSVHSKEESQSLNTDMRCCAEAPAAP